ncbi:MAG: VWA domain-containing protein [Treponemataceae bacterium]|nr:VWA domain-containing protein [Treponemataceae bacterium]
MLTFENYYALFMLLVIPVFAVLYETKVIRRVSLPLLFADWQGRSFEWKSKRVMFFKGLAMFLCVFSYIFIVLALANPRITKHEKRYISRGSEVMFVLDESPSMSALDVNGKRRIDAAKDAIKSVTESISGTSFGLIAIGSEASCLMSPSMDSKAIEEKIKDFKLGALGDGTALGVGISSAIYHLSSSMSPQKLIILITDGENNAGTIHPYTAAKLAADQKIPVYVLGIGSEGTVAIEYTDPATGKTYSGFLESTYNYESLEKIADISNGNFFEIQNLDEMKTVINSIIQNDIVIPHFYTVSVDKEYYKVFILLAGIFFGLSYLIQHFYLKEIL